MGEYTHTHTHTHTHTSSFKKKLVVVSIILIVWIIAVCYTVNRIKFYNGVSGNQENIAQTGEIEPREVDISIWDTEKVEIYTDEVGAKVPVPKGYVVSGKDGEHTVNTGLVIYEGEEPVTNENAWEESKTRNQWVWVPVSDISRIYETYSNGKKKAKLYNVNKTGRTVYGNSNYEPGVLSDGQYGDGERNFARYNMQGMTKERFLQQLQLEYEEMIASVEKYGGYYIGRYETGSLTSKEPVVQRMQDTVNVYTTWYASYEKMKLMGANSNVQAGLIWGSLWDETLQWLVDSGNKTYEDMVDSTSWGNYSNAEFDYIITSGDTAHKNSNSYVSSVRTGSSEYTNANNIYDLAGSQWEWTMEADGSNYRRFRGGYYSNTGSFYPASYRGNGGPNVNGRGASILLHKIEAFEKTTLDSKLHNNIKIKYNNNSR